MVYGRAKRAVRRPDANAGSVFGEQGDGRVELRNFGGRWRRRSLDRLYGVAHSVLHDPRLDSGTIPKSTLGHLDGRHFVAALGGFAGFGQSVPELFTFWRAVVGFRHALSCRGNRRPAAGTHPRGN